MLKGAAPAVCLFAHDGALRFALIAGRWLGWLVLVGPDLKKHYCRPDWLEDAMCNAQQAPLAREIDKLLEAARIPLRHRQRTRKAMIAQRLRGETVAGCWILRPRAQNSLAQQFRHAGLAQRVAGMLAVFALVYGLEM